MSKVKRRNISVHIFMNCGKSCSLNGHLNLTLSCMPNTNIHAQILFEKSTEITRGTPICTEKENTLKIPD